MSHFIASAFDFLRKLPPGGGTHADCEPDKVHAITQTEITLLATGYRGWKPAFAAECTGPFILLPIPFAMAEMQAGLLELLPNSPLTRDQVRLLKTDKVASGAELTLGDLGVQLRPLDEFLTVFKDK